MPSSTTAESAVLDAISTQVFGLNYTLKYIPSRIIRYSVYGIIQYLIIRGAVVTKLRRRGGDGAEVARAEMNRNCVTILHFQTRLRSREGESI